MAIRRRTGVGFGRMFAVELTAPAVHPPRTISVFVVHRVLLRRRPRATPIVPVASDGPSKIGLIVSGPAGHARTVTSAHAPNTAGRHDRHTSWAAQKPTARAAPTPPPSSATPATPAELAEPAADRTVPQVDDATSAAAGKLSEALEWVERARGALYSFHQLSGRADLILGEALDALREAGHPRLAAEVRRELHGRNVLDGRWTFQIVEEYDDLYYRPFVSTEERVRALLTDGQRHVYEARMKARERSGAGRDLWGPGA